MRIIYAAPEGPAWFPLTHMVDLMARCLAADLTVVRQDRAFSRIELLGALRGRRSRGTEDLLVVCPNPTTMRLVLADPSWRTGYRTVAAWVVDSWWDDRIPRLARRPSVFDLVYLTEAENRSSWEDITGARIEHLPIGSDVVDNGFDPDRPASIDVRRVGRMPQAWDDDALLDRLCRERGLSFAGRPAFADTPEEGLRLLWEAELRSRFVLSFSNAVSPDTRYTHPTAEYLTYRWTDALGCGCTTAGTLPRTRTVTDLLWEGANVDVPHDDPAAGLDVVAEHVRAWTPERSLRNRRQALATLDWRHRFDRIRVDLGLDAPELDRELERLGAAADSLPA